MIVSRAPTEYTKWCKDYKLDRIKLQKEVSQHLEMLLASPDFDATQTLRTLLQYLINQTLAGNADSIDEFTVATNVFGRGFGYDPANDPIAMIQTDRLRRALERYYRTTGKQSSVRIEIFKGTYVPTFRENSEK